MRRVRSLLLVSVLCTAWWACTEGSGPTASGNALALGIVPSFQVDPALFATDPIDRIRLTAYVASTQAVVGSFDQSVSPTADEWAISLDIDLGDAESLQIVVDAELLSQGTVVWSGRLGPLTVPTSAPALAMDVYPGPLDNQDVTLVDIFGAPAVMAASTSTSLGVELSLVPGSDATPVIYWASSDEDVATVTPSTGSSVTLTAVAPGTVNIIATAGSAYDEVTVEVLAPGSATKAWVGGTATNPTLWSEASNWVPVGVPTSTDNVSIPATANDPDVDVAVVVNSLTVESGATVDLGQNGFQVVGDLEVSGAVVNGTLEVTGTGSLLEGDIDGLLVSANRTLSALLDLTGNLTLVARLTTNGQPLYVGGDLSTTSTGQLSMSSGVVTVSGSASFLGGSHEGLLTGGTLRVSGDFTAGGTEPLSFAAAQAHSLVLDGSTAQTIDIAQPGPSGGQFGTLVVENAVGVDLAGDAYSYDMTVDGVLVVGAGQTFDVANQLTLQAGSTLDVDGTVTAASCVNNGAVLLGTGTQPCGTGGITKTWVGGDPGGSATDWANPANWNPTGVPTASDAVLIPITANQPALSVDTSVESLVVANTASLNLNGQILSVSGDLAAGSTGVSNGIVQVTGAGSLLEGSVPTLEVLGNRALSGNLFVSADLVVSDAELDTNGQFVSVGIAMLLTGPAARLIMTSSANSFYVGGEAYFNGASHEGFLTAGSMSVGANFTVTASSSAGFAATGTHWVAFDGTTPQTVSFASPGATQQRFQDVTISNGSGVSFATDAYIAGDLGVTGRMEVPLGSTVTIAGDLTLSSLSELNVEGTLDVLGACIDNGATITGTGTQPCGAPTATDYTWTGATSNAWEEPDNWNPVGVPGSLDAVLIPGSTTTPVLNADTEVASITVSGSNALNLNSFTLTVTGDVSMGVSGGFAGLVHVTGAGSLLEGVVADLQVSADRVVSGPLSAYGNMTLEALLDTNGQPVTVLGDLTVQGTGGVLRMRDAATDVYVGGNALFNGGDHEGEMTDGYLSLAGDLTATSASPTSFVSSANHWVQFSGSAGQTVSFDVPGPSAQRFAYVEIFGLLGVTFATNVHIESALDVGGRLEVLASTETTVGGGISLFGGSVLLNEGTITGSCSDFGAIILGSGLQSCGEPLPVDRYWTGATSSNWDEPDNWEPAGVPQPSESVLVLYQLNRATLAQDVAVTNLYVQSSTQLDLGGFTITVDGNVEGQGYVFNGTTVVTGTGTALEGYFETLIVAGPRTTTGFLYTDLDLIVRDRLTVGPDGLQSFDRLTVETATGELVMDGGSGVVFVQGTATFDGASLDGDLTGGDLYLYGDFIVLDTNLSGDAFRSTGTDVWFFGSTDQTVSFSNPGPDNGQQSFQNVQIAKNFGSLTFTSDAYVTGDLGAGGPEVLVGNGATVLEVNGTLNVFDVTFNGLMLELITSETAELHSLANLTFTGMDPAVTQLFLSLPPGAGGESLVIDSPSFVTVPSGGGFYISAENFSANQLVVQVNSPSPTDDGGYTTVAGNTVINWGP